MSGEQPVFHLPELLQIIHGLPQLLVHRGLSCEEKDCLCASWELSWGAGLKQRPRSTADSPILQSECQMHIFDLPFLIHKVVCA